MDLKLGSRRATYVDISEELKGGEAPFSSDDISVFEQLDLTYRTLCAILYNYVPMSGHPGGSVSSGRFVECILFDAMDYDVSDPDRQDADLISYAAGHKALGLYAMWALRNEVIRIAAPELLPADVRLQLRLEDLLGFRKNPITDTPLFKQFRSKALDGHPTPATPFLKLSTGASGVGVATSLGLAYGAKDFYGHKAPRVHIVEGEGGLTPGRVYETLAAAGTASLDNAVLHIDWNQASIDSNNVCREGDTPGDYVQWDPKELAYMHDWNVIYVPDGTDFHQIVAAQRLVPTIANSQPTAIVYRTTKGWLYGIEGKASHGAGHSLCSDGFHHALAPFVHQIGSEFPKCQNGEKCCGGSDMATVEDCYWQSLQIIRDSLENNETVTGALAQRLIASRDRLDTSGRGPRANAPAVDMLHAYVAAAGTTTPDELKLEAGSKTTVRGALGNALNVLNKVSDGSILAASADLLGSTSINASASGFSEGFYNANSNPEARLLSIGGICEDAMSGILAGISTYGRHVGAGSSYGAFIGALGHISSRLHAIGSQARQQIKTEPYNPYVLICAHAGLKTGEDGPTHADPQPLQLLQDNFPDGTVITMTPWDPQEVWPLLIAALIKRPAVVVPFVTRPNENVIDRKALGLAPPEATVTGVYALRKANGGGDGALLLQGSEVAFAFVETALPMLEKEGVDLEVYYVSSAELFAQLPEEKRQEIYPESVAMKAMGITGFTLPTLYKWVRSDKGIKSSMHPFQKGHFLGSGPGDVVLKEAGLDGESQFNAIMDYVKS